MSLLHYIALTQVTGIGSITGRKLLNLYKDPINIFNEKKSILLKIPFITQNVINSLNSKEIFLKAEKELKFAEKNNIHILTIDSENYPYRLKQIPDAPLLLYVKGNLNLSPLKSIAIVGTRSASEYGKNFTHSLVNRLKHLSIQIISGLAYGIDTIAHKSALENNLETIAVLGHGLDIIYPSGNFFLAKSIIENNGALITEYCSETKPNKENFPKRNRIIAGLADAVVVIESSIKGGALITAKLGLSYNRDIFAVPGKTIDNYSQGCNWLIKTQQAQLIDCAEDLLYHMNWNLPNATTEQHTQAKLFLSEEEEILYQLIKNNENCSIETLCNESGFTLNKTATLLLNMELMGIIKCYPGKIYKII